MDTLFRLVSYHPDQQSFNSTSRTSSSSRSSPHHPNHDSSSGSHHHHLHLHHQYRIQQHQDDQECCNANTSLNHHTPSSAIYMDEDDFSSSSSRHFFSSSSYPQQQNPSSASTATTPATTTYTYTPPTTATSTTPPHHLSPFEPSEFSSPAVNFDYAYQQPGKWASDLLLDCARAVSASDTARVQHLMWMLNELSSPYGDVDQKLASYFLQALFSRMTSSGSRCLRTLAAASDRATSFDSTRRVALRFQEASPWSTFGHVASNGAILESLDGEQRLHIIDFSNTFCTQWPTLLEALATRSSDETPHLRLTTVVAAAAPSPSVQKVMKEIGARMEKFARLMGVPFKFQYIHHAGDLSGLDFDSLGVNSGEALAINCVNTLHGVPTAAGRDAVAAAFRRLRPRVVTVVEEEADIGTDGASVDGSGGDHEFLRGFRESLKFFAAYFESLEESFPKTSNERLALERSAGRAIVDLVACELGESGERRETGSRWSRRMRDAGFGYVGLSDDSADDVRALLRRYKDGWSLLPAADVDRSAAGIFLAWKEQPVVWACAWRP